MVSLLTDGLIAPDRAIGLLTRGWLGGEEFEPPTSLIATVVQTGRIISSTNGTEFGGVLMAVLSPLRVWRGETKTWTFTVWDVDTEERLNLGIYTEIEFQVKTDIEGADPALVSKNIAGGGVEVLDQSSDATKGQLKIKMLPADTSGVNTPIGLYKYDLWGIVGSSRFLLAKPADFTIEGVVNKV